MNIQHATFDHMAPPQDNYIIHSKQQMRALAAATRQEIVDVLPRMGAVSVAELAAALGRPADSLYYHLRVLTRVGLVLRSGSRAVNGRAQALFRAIAPEMSLSYKFGKQGNANEVNAIIASMLRLGARDFRRSFRSGEVRVSGLSRELWALRTTGRLSRAQIAEVNRYIRRLMQIAAQPGYSGRLYAITVLLIPLDRKGRVRRLTTRLTATPTSS
ncbi:MAG TPA: helix-turn-helix domain-containing protein [Terriglobales bacterium]|jgi:DNA-binding transcriptional ArsR family regulator